MSTITELPNQHTAHAVVLRQGLHAPEIAQPTHVDQERAAGVRRAVDLIHDGRPGRALYELVRSVQRQAFIEGLGRVDVAPTCPCGGRCPAGTSAAR